MKNHKSNCQCCICKNKRGEYKGVNCPNYERHPTEKTIQKLREANKNHRPNCQCISCKSKRGEHTGWHHTAETGRKISQARIGIVFSEETIQKMRENHFDASGSNNPNWQGGIGSLPYPFDFNNELKELIRKRDNYTCQLCGRVKEDDGRKLAVHHIDYIKENLDPNNLLTLCSGCNGKVNFNRKSWTKFFGLKLKFA